MCHHQVLHCALNISKVGIKSWKNLEFFVSFKTALSCNLVELPCSPEGSWPPAVLFQFPQCRDCNGGTTPRGRFPKEARWQTKMWGYKRVLLDLYVLECSASDRAVWAPVWGTGWAFLLSWENSGISVGFHILLLVFLITGELLEKYVSMRLFETSPWMVRESCHLRTVSDRQQPPRGYVSFSHEVAFLVLLSSRFSTC